jgi:acetyl esterase/lipase
MTKITLLLSMALLATNLLFAETEACTAPTTPDNMRAFENIIYKGDLGMDLYLPEHGENLPLAFIIHGGGWIQGDRKDFNPFAKQLTGMGYAAVTVSYRLANKADGKFPAPVEDLRCALKTLRNKKAEYSINTDRIIALGQSAGAHLAAEIALTADSSEFNDSLCPVQNHSTEVQSVVGYFGPYDLRDISELNLGQIWILSNFLGGLPSFNPKLAELASPAAQINDETVPFYLVQAANDDVVPVKSSRDFNQTLLDAGKDVRYVETTDGKHTLKYFDDREFAKEATCGTIETLDKFYKASF